MTDLAVLGMRFETHGADEAARKMDAVEAGAKKVEAASDGMSGASRKSGSAMAEMAQAIANLQADLA